MDFSFIVNHFYLIRHHHTDLVWKVARYTSASPIFFGEFENYVDGGVLANNPCDSGMTAIQNFYRLQGEKLRIALVVSVGESRYVYLICGITLTEVVISSVRN